VWASLNAPICAYSRVHFRAASSEVQGAYAEAVPLCAHFFSAALISEVEVEAEALSLCGLSSYSSCMWRLCIIGVNLSSPLVA